MGKRGRHKSLTNDLDRSVRWLESLSRVEKVILGRTESCRHSYPPGHIRPQRDAEGGFRVIGYSGNGVVDIYVVAAPENLDELKKLILARFKC